MTSFLLLFRARLTVLKRTSQSAVGPEALRHSGLFGIIGAIQICVKAESARRNNNHKHQNNNNHDDCTTPFGNSKVCN